VVLAIALVQYAFVMVLASLIVGGLHRPPGDARAPYLEPYDAHLTNMDARSPFIEPIYHDPFDPYQPYQPYMANMAIWPKWPVFF
jgi:hypothetical protein